MRRQVLVATVVLASVLGSGCAGESREAPAVATSEERVPGPSRKLNGTWQSDLMTVNIDFERGTYSGVAFGQSFSRKVSLVREYANVVEFKSDSSDIVAQLQEDGSVLLTKQGEEGGIPVLLKRVE